MSSAGLSEENHCAPLGVCPVSSPEAAHVYNKVDEASGGHLMSRAFLNESTNLSNWCQKLVPEFFITTLSQFC